MNQTIPAIFFDRAEREADHDALLVKRSEKFEPVTWKALAQDVSRMVAVLKSLGVSPGDRVLHVSENRYEWIVTDLAIQTALAIHVPVHASLTGPQIIFQLVHSEARVVIISTSTQADKLSECSHSVPESTIFLSYDPCDQQIGDRPLKLVSNLRERLDHIHDASTCQQAFAQLSPDSLATILYTSGTTGQPKGVMLSHANLVSNTYGAIEGVQLGTREVRINLLPFSHIFARTCDLYAWFAVGGILALAESPETAVADCAMIRPTVMNAVPYFYDKLRQALIALQLDTTPGSLRQLLGGNIQVCCSGGAALPNHIFDFFHKQGVLLFEGYGLSETSPVIAVSSPAEHRRGSVGRPIPDVEVRVAEDGEFLTRGPHVMVGYYKNPEATKEALQDGWFATGDLGYVDHDGFLYITGRKKELLVTAGGKNIAPTMLETLLSEDPLIFQAMIIGNAKNYLTALIVPDLQALQTHLSTVDRSLNLDPAARGNDIFPTAGLYAFFEERIAQRLKSVSKHEQVRRFTLLDRPFTVETGELTPKMSLRRATIEEHFAAEILAMYSKSSSGGVDFNLQAE